MANARVLWLEKAQFVGIDSGRHSVVMSTQDEANGTGIKPSEMLLLGLAGCTAVDVVSILSKKREPLAALEIEIESEQAPEAPWAFERIRLHYRLRGEGLSEAGVQRAITLAEEKYCPVAASLRPQVEIKVDFEILPSADSRRQVEA